MINATKIHTITIKTCTINCMLSISCKFSSTFSSFDIFIINNCGNVLLIGFALVDGMPELLMFVCYKCHKHGFHGLLVSYKEYDQCYQKYNVPCKGHMGKYDQQDLPLLCIL